MADRVISYDFRGNFASLTAGLAASGKSVAAFGTKLTALDANGAKMRAGLSTIGTAAGKMGLAAAAGLGAVVLVTAKFDKAMSNVAATGQDARDSFDELRQAAIDAGAETAFSASEAAAGIENLLKAGVSAADVLGGGLSGALDLAAAGGLEVADAAEIAATAMTQFSLGGQDVSHVADLLAAGAGKAQGDVSDMGMALKQSGLVAAQVGLTIEETTGTLAAFASAGLIGSDAGTSFKTMLQSLTPSGAKARETMEELGITAYDAQGNFIGMTEFAANLQNGLKDLSVEQQNAAMKTIFGSDAVRAAAVIFDQGADGVQNWIDNVNDSGYAAETAGVKLDNLAGDWEELTGSIETALIGSGEGSTGIIREMVQGATNLTNAFNDLSPAAKNATTGLLAITAITGGALWFGSKVIGGIASTKLALDQLGISAGKSSRLMAGLGKGVTFAAIGVSLKVITDQLDKLAGRKLEGDIYRNLEALTNGQTVGNLEKMGLHIENFNSGFEKVKANMFGWVPFDDTLWEEGRDEVQKVDEALASMVETGNEAMAADAFNRLVEMAVKEGVSAKDAADAFDQYAIALDNLAARRRGLAALPDNMREDSLWATFYADATDGVTEATKEAARASKAQAQALQEVRNAAGETAASFVNLTEGVKGNKATLSGWIKEMADQADALRNFTLNAVEAGEKGVNQGLISHLRELGPEGAKQLRWLANASEKEIARANAAWARIVDATNNYKDAVTGVPALNVKVQDAEGRKRIAQIQHLVDKFGMTKAEARAFIRDAATDKAKAIQRLVDKFGATKAEATALLRDMATGDIAAVRRALRDLNGDEAVVTIRTNHIVDRSGMRGMGGPTTKSAMGDIFNGHQPQIARGHTRIWAEPETGGEAYIPLRNDHRRPRAKSIAAETVGLLGGQVSWFARGGLNGGFRSSTGDNWSGAMGDNWSSGVRAFNDDLALTGEFLRNDLRDRLKESRERQRMAEKEAAQAKNKFEAERDYLNELKDARRSFAQSVSGNFMSGLFGDVDLAQAAADGLLEGGFYTNVDNFTRASGGDPAAAMDEQVRAYLDSLNASQLAALQAQANTGALQQNTQDASAFQAALEQLVGLGFDGGAFQELAASGNLGAAQFYAGQTPEQIALMEQRYEQRNQAAQQVGNYAGNAEFRADIRAQTAAVRESREELREANQINKRLEKRIERLEKAITDIAPEKTGRAVGREINNAVRAGERRN